MENPLRKLSSGVEEQQSATRPIIISESQEQIKIND